MTKKVLSQLTWQDMEAVIAAEGSIYDECGPAEETLKRYPTKESFYGEVLNRLKTIVNNGY